MKPQNTFNKSQWLSNKKQKVNDLQNELQQIIKSFSEDPNEIVDLLIFANKFSNYSIRNVMLIKKQRKNACYVASFSKLKQLGYMVNKGEKAIKIFAPSVKKCVKLDGKLKYLTELSDEEKERISQEKIQVFSFTDFYPVNVFDVSQTNIPLEDIPKYFQYEGLQNYCIEEKIRLLEEYLAQKEIKLELADNLPLGHYGSYNPNTNSIEISSNLKGDSKLATLSHELGHSLLHYKNSKLNNNKEEAIEVQADCVAILLFNYFDLEIPKKTKRHLIENISKLSEDDLQNCLLPIIDESLKLISDLKKDISVLTQNEIINEEEIAEDEVVADPFAAEEKQEEGMTI